MTFRLKKTRVVSRTMTKCSFAVAFKQEHLEGGAKFKENIGKKKQIYERFGEYFTKAFDLFENKEDAEKYILFKHFFTHNTFNSILQRIEEDYKTKRIQFEEELLQIKERIKFIHEDKSLISKLSVLKLYCETICL